MTSTARMSRETRPAWLDWNAWAVPAKFVVMCEGRVWRATRCTSATAVPSETPGFRSKDRVTDGNWPEWVTVSGPTLEPSVARDASGTRPLVCDLMYSRLRADRSCWYSGSSSISTQYWFVGV